MVRSAKEEGCYHQCAVGAVASRPEPRAHAISVQLCLEALFSIAFNMLGLNASQLYISVFIGFAYSGMASQERRSACLRRERTTSRRQPTPVLTANCQNINWNNGFKCVDFGIETHFDGALGKASAVVICFTPLLPLMMNSRPVEAVR